MYKKTEKLVVALYMITDYITDNEPLKWRLRENGLELLSLNTAFPGISPSEHQELLKEYRAISVEITSLAEVACHGGLISEMNCTVMKKEFENLLSMMEKDENQKAGMEGVILTPDFFDQVDEPNVLYKLPAVHDKGHFQKTTVPDIDLSRTRKKPEYLPSLPRIQKESAGGKGDRRAVIINLLSKRDGLNIKDFSQNIRGCSEKTIQRELLAMVAKGILKKEGEKRWSTYSLAG